MAFTPKPSPQAEKGIRVDVSHLPVGIYFVRIGNQVEKFVVWR